MSFECRVRNSECRIGDRPFSIHISHAKNALANLVFRLEKDGDYEAAAHVSNALAALMANDITSARDLLNAKCRVQNSEFSTLHSPLPESLSLLAGLCEAIENEHSHGDNPGLRIADCGLPIAH